MHNNVLANKIGALTLAISDLRGDEDISASSISTILTLHHWGAMSVTQLAGIIDLSQPATTRLLARLKTDGLVRERQVLGRVRPVALTGKGQKKARKLARDRAHMLSNILSPLSAKEQQSLDGALSKILIGLVDNRATARRLCRQCDHGICTGAKCPIGSEATRLERQV